jgi:hypothetical protein
MTVESDLIRIRQKLASLEQAGQTLFISYNDGDLSGMPVDCTGDGTANGWYTDYDPVAHPTQVPNWMSIKRSSSIDTGTWSSPMAIHGAAGAAGTAGNFIDHVFTRAATIPATPTGNGLPAGWSDAPPVTEKVLNGGFETWTAGVNLAPDNWSLSGASATIARESTIKKLGTYSAKLTRAGADCQLMQDITPVEYWRGKTVTFGCWVYATVAGRAMAYITDNIGSAASSYHTGDSTWQWLTVTYKVNANATFLRVMPYIATDDTAAYFDGAKFSYLKPSTTIAGLDIHEGKTLSVFADGVRFDDDVVENGFITASLSGVATPYTKAIVGLPYTAILQPKRIVMNTPSGSSMGKTTHVSGLVISFMNTGAAKYGVDMDHLFSIDFTDIRWTNSSTITGLFSGEVTVPCPGNFDPLNPIFITSDGPMPLTVRAICPEIEAR